MDEDQKIGSATVRWSPVSRVGNVKLTRVVITGRRRHEDSLGKPCVDPAKAGDRRWLSHDDDAELQRTIPWQSGAVSC